MQSNCYLNDTGKRFFLSGVFQFFLLIFLPTFKMRALLFLALIFLLGREVHSKPISDNSPDEIDRHVKENIAAIVEKAKIYLRNFYFHQGDMAPFAETEEDRSFVSSNSRQRRDSEDLEQAEPIPVFAAEEDENLRDLPREVTRQSPRRDVGKLPRRILSSGSKEKKLEQLMKEAKEILGEEAMAKVDLEADNAAEELRRLIEEKQNSSAKYVFGLKYTVRRGKFKFYFYFLKSRLKFAKCQRG